MSRRIEAQELDDEEAFWDWWVSLMIAELEEYLRCWAIMDDIHGSSGLGSA